MKNLLNEDDYAFILKGVNRMDVEINRAIKFLQIATDLRLLQKRADVRFFLFCILKSFEI